MWRRSAAGLLAADPSREGTSRARRSTQSSRSSLLSSKRRRVELGAELLDGAECIAFEDVLDDADLRVVVERQVDVLARDEVHRDRRADRAAHGDAERAARPERAGRTTTGRPAAAVPPGSRRSSTATRPPGCAARRDRRAPLRRRRRCAVIRLTNVPPLEPERRPVEIVVRDEARRARRRTRRRTRRGRRRDALRPGAARARGTTTARTRVSAPVRARERVRARQSASYMVVVVIGSSDGTPDSPRL